jgi:hypothetical protein
VILSLGRSDSTASQAVCATCAAHAAALRYGVMGAPRASEPTEKDEPWEVHRKRELLRKHDERVVNPRGRFEWV